MVGDAPPLLAPRRNQPTCKRPVVPRGRFHVAASYDRL